MSKLNENTEKSSENQMTKFISILQDFTRDLLTTFPEYAETLDPRLKKVINNSNDPENTQSLLDYCKKIYPERFFDLLYKNNKIFVNMAYNTHFLPNIEFKDVWKQDISDKTRTIIWKYLQLVCFIVINGENDVDSFGDTTKLFEAIGEEELKKKLGETISQMSEFLDISGTGNPLNPFFDISENLPDPEELHEHINGLMNGKLGRLASEITEETMKEFTDLSGISSVGDVFKNLFKNPGKLMKMVKKLGDSLDSKIKSGEIKESELMEEAAELMEKLKKVPGMKNMKDIFGQMGLDGLDMLGGKGNGKLNLGAMQGQMNRNVRMAKQRDRMRAKLAARNVKNTTKDQQISLLEKQLADAQETNRMLESMHATDSNPKKKSKKKKRRRRRNKK